VLNTEDVGRLALALPGAIEADHHGIPSFRVAGKIFCTIHGATGRLMVKLDPEDQANLAAGHPGVVEPVPGYWGRKGSTFVNLSLADQALAGRLIRMAWTRVAPAKLKTQVMPQFPKSRTLTSNRPGPRLERKA
jgi:hypothetical protein